MTPGTGRTRGAGRFDIIKTKDTVIDEIVDKYQGDIEKASSILDKVSGGQIQYIPDRSIFWISVPNLKQEILKTQKKRKIDNQNARAKTIANAVGSAVVILPTDTKSKTIMLVIAFGTMAVAYTTKFENKFINALFYSAIIATSFYIVVKMTNAVAKAKGGINQMVITP